jgi:hypothetical protein
VSDDPIKCVHMHLGMASGCHYTTYDRGRLEECTVWQCSAACKDEQRRMWGPDQAGAKKEGG